MIVYNKLVRDRIPEIIEQQGEQCKIKQLSTEELGIELKKKLIEEQSEYMKAETNEEAIEELADLLEIIRMLAKIHQSSIEEVEKIRKRKKTERGGFEKGVYLISI